MSKKENDEEQDPDKYYAKRVADLAELESKHGIEPYPHKVSSSSERANDRTWVAHLRAHCLFSLLFLTHLANPSFTWSWSCGSLCTSTPL